MQIRKVALALSLIALILSYAVIIHLKTETKSQKPPATRAAQEKPTEPNVAGTWDRFRGQAVDKLMLIDNGGVLRGTLTEDAITSSGKSWEVNGLRVGNKIQWSYSVKKSDGGWADFSMDGTVDSDTMNGTCKLSIVTVHGDGTTTPTSKEILWIAKRKKP